MNWIDAERRIYDLALQSVAKNNKALARVYLNVAREIEDELKRFYALSDPSWSAQYQAQRLSEIFKTVNLRLSQLTKISTGTIERSFLGVYQTTFNSYAYDLSDYYTGRAFAPGFVILPFSQVNESVIMSALNEKIGEYSFKKSMYEKQVALRQDLREAVAISIKKGEGVLKLTQRLKDSFSSGLMRYTSTARTEMLKAYSLAQLESYKQSEDLGIEFSAPLWTGNNDGRERATHVYLNNTFAQKANNGKYYFHAGGCKGEAPRLFTGRKSAGMNVNCRCRMVRLPMQIDTSRQFPTIETKGQAPGTGRPDFAAFIKMLSE